MLEAQCVVLFDAEGHSVRVSIERVLDQFEDVHPPVIEGKVQHPQHAFAIARAVEPPILSGK